MSPKFFRRGANQAATSTPSNPPHAAVKPSEMPISYPEAAVATVVPDPTHDDTTEKSTRKKGALRENIKKSSEFSRMPNRIAHTNNAIKYKHTMIISMLLIILQY